MPRCQVRAVEARAIPRTRRLLRTGEADSTQGRRWPRYAIRDRTPCRWPVRDDRQEGARPAHCNAAALPYGRGGGDRLRRFRATTGTRSLFDGTAESMVREVLREPDLDGDDGLGL